MTEILFIKNIETADGRLIAARYLEHSAFDSESTLHLDLHRVFITTTTDRHFSFARNLNKAIELFIDFITHHNQKQPESLRLSSLESLNTEVFRAYIKYLRKRNRPIYAAHFKQGINAFADLIPSFNRPALPKVGIERSAPTEPLSDDCLDQLKKTLRTEIDVLYDKVAFIKKVDQAEPYTWDEAIAEIYPEKTKGDVFKWWKDSITNKDKGKHFQLRGWIKNCNDSEIRNLAHLSNSDLVQGFISIYERDHDLIDTSKLRPFKNNGGMRLWKFDISRALKTLLEAGYPMEMSLDHIAERYKHDSVIGIDDCKNVQDLLMLRMIRSGTKYKYKEAGGSWDGLLAKYFPSMIDAAALYLMIAIQSGWNKETIFAIDSESFEHALAGVLNENQTLIYSEKNRSQGINLPYNDPKQFLAPSNKDDKYSIYNLIELCKKISEPLYGYEFDFIHAYHEESDLNPLFLCIRYWADWVSKGGRHTSLSQQKAFSIGIRHLLKKLGIAEHGKPLTKISEITLRTRATWINQKRKKLPLSVVRLIQGHESQVTTDVFYDSSGVAKQSRKIRLRAELEDITRQLRARQFEGLVSNHANRQANASLKVFHIPGHENDLWGCSDQYNPTWHGHESHVRKESKCCKILKCIFCQQVRLFDDSVPYLLTRQDYLIAALDINEHNGSDLVEEQEIIRSILDDWDDDDLIKESARFIRRNPNLLPSNLDDLQIIFEDEESA